MEKPSIRTQRNKMHLKVLGLKFMMKTYKDTECELSSILSKFQAFWRPVCVSHHLNLYIYS